MIDIQIDVYRISILKCYVFVIIGSCLGYLGIIYFNLFYFYYVYFKLVMDLVFGINYFSNYFSYVVILLILK